MEAVDVVEDERDDDRAPATIQQHARLAVLDDDAFEDVGDVLAAVGGVLEEVEHLLPLHHDDRIALLVEQLADRLLVDAVGFVLEPVDLDRVRRRRPCCCSSASSAEADLIGARR